MSTRELKAGDVTTWLQSFWSALGVFFPKKPAAQYAIWQKCQIHKKQGNTITYVATDASLKGKVVGLVTYTREWSMRTGGAYIYTITELLVLPGYENTAIYENLTNRVIRSAIADEAILVRVATTSDKVQFFEKHLFHHATDKVLMERSLPWERYKREPKVETDDDE